MELHRALSRTEDVRFVGKISATRCYSHSQLDLNQAHIVQCEKNCSKCSNTLSALQQQCTQRSYCVFSAPVHRLLLKVHFRNHEYMSESILSVNCLSVCFFRMNCENARLHRQASAKQQGFSFLLWNLSDLLIHVITVSIASAT